MARPKVAVDFDDTLVHDQLWLPGAAHALRWLDRNTDLYIHTCRGNYPEGIQLVRDTLAQQLAPRRAAEIRVEPKPAADFYIDDRAHQPDWDKVVDLIARRGR